MLDGLLIPIPITFPQQNINNLGGEGVLIDMLCNLLSNSPSSLQGN